MERYYLIILLFIFSSCNKDELGEIVIDDNNNLKPVKLYDTSIQNHEWNSGWFDNLTMSTKHGGTSPVFFIEDLLTLIMKVMVIWMFSYT